MLSERDTDVSESVEEESTTPKAAVTMDRAEDKQEEERSINGKQEGTVTTKNVIIFSDSMAKYTQQYLSSREFSYRVVFHRGAQIHDVTHNIKEFSASDFDNTTVDVVVLHVGTNNLCNSQTLDHNKEDYKELLQSAVSRFPNAGILVSGILPRFDSEDLNDAAQTYNIILAQLSKTFADKVKFVDLGSHFRSERFFAIDGLHLSYQGNPRFAAKLQEAVEYHFSTDPEHIRWKETFSAAMQKVPFPKPFLLGPQSSGKVEQTSRREAKPRVPRKCFKSVKRNVKESNRSRRKCWHPKQEKKCTDVSNWTGWTRCQGPTAACSPSGNGPKWKTEYLIRTNCCLYERPRKTSPSHQPEGNTKRGKKRKKLGPSKVDPNPRDLDKLEELLAEFADQSTQYQDPDPHPRKRKRQCSGEPLLEGKNQDHRIQQEDSKGSSPSTDCHVNPQPACTNDEAEGNNTADLHGDKCPSYPVYIQMWDGQLLTADVAGNSTVKELHETVAKFYKNGLPKEASFYRGGLKVKEEMPLKHQGIVAESTVQVLLKLKGGGDKGDAEASGEAKAVRHMAEWTEEEAIQWMKTQAKMRPDEVKPLVEEQVDGLALWGMTVESLKKHFSCMTGGAKIKLLKALKSYKESWPNFEQVTLPDELPSDVTCWMEKEIKVWLSCVVKLRQNDIDSICALDLDGDSLLKLDEETVRELELLPEMKQGPLVKLFFCLKKLNQPLSKRNLGVEDVVGGKDKEAEISSSNVETSLNEGASNISDSMAESIVDAAGDTNKAKATEAFVDVSDNKNESLAEDKSTTDTDKGGVKHLVDVKDEVVKASKKDVDPERTSLGTLGSDKEPTPAPSDASKQVPRPQPAQAQSTTKSVKQTEKETAILQLLRSSGLNLYESQFTEHPQQCEIMRIYARPKKKNELDQLFNFLVIRKVTGIDPPTQSQVSEFTKHLWGKIRKDLCHWVDFLPKKNRKDYHVDQTATSSENVFRSKDKTVISLSKKDPTSVPLGQVDIDALKSIKTATTIFIVEESFKTEEPQEYITTCGAKDKKYYFHYCKNDKWHASFDERNLMEGFVIKTNVMTAKSDLVLLEKMSETDKESPSVPPQSPKETVPASKGPTKSKEAVKDTCATDSKLPGPGKTAQQDSATSINTNTLDVKKRNNVGANQSSIMDEEQASCTDDSKRSDTGTSQKSPPSAQPRLPAPSSTISSAMPSTSSTNELQRPFPFGRNDTGKYSYKSGAVLTVMESGAGSLLSPCHEFKVFQRVKATDQKISFEAKEYFIYETLRFATGCINARCNGTIHFGVGDDVGGNYLHGEIVGIELQEQLKPKFDDLINDSISTCFTQDWAISAVNQCIYPVRFIPLQQEHSEASVIKYVIEVDVVPTFALTQNRAFFIKFRKMKIHKMQPGEYLFFRKRASTVCLSGSDLDDFQNNLLHKLAQDRNMEEKNSISERPSYNHEYAKKLEGCLLGGEADLRTKYPILFVSKPDFQSKYSQDMKSELSFITEIPWIAIFDLDPNSDDSGICHLFRSQMKKECSLYQPEEKFLHISDHEELADAILFPEKTCWIFANGRHALDVKPYDATKWNGTERCKAVKNAINFFARHDKIPQGKAVIVFLILSEKMEIVVNCFRYCFDDFCGIDNFVCLFENQNTYELWENQVQGVGSLEDLQGKSIVGMPWEHINQTVQFIHGLKVQSEPLIPTSSGSYVSLTNQQRNKLDDLEVLSKNQCEDLDLDPESDYFEKICQKKEMMFYKGNEVDWLNFFLTDVHFKNHVMKREKFRKLHELVTASLFQRDPQLKGKSVIITLYYQAGSGATTLGRHILWEFRESKVRCCVIKRITEDTASQILTLRRYGEETENEIQCLPVLMLIDNENEERVKNLITGIERQIKKKGIVTEKPVCIILQCKRTQDAKKYHDDNPTTSEYLEQSVSDKEMRWLENKQKELEGTILEGEGLSSDDDYYTEYAEDADEFTTGSEKSLLRTPLNLDKRFIKFMILRKNFDPEFVRNFVANSLKDIEGNELLLLRYTALLNVFVEKEDSYVPLHCAEALMGINENKYRTMGNTLSRAVKVFLIVVERYTCGIVEGYKIVDSLIASEVLEHMVAENETYSSIACDFLESRLFCTTYTTKELIFFTKEMLKRRKKFAYGDDTETQFSLLVECICKKEGHENAAAVLQKGLTLDKFVDPIIAQTLARLFLRHDDFAQAHEYADIAVEQDSKNSYLLVTAGKVYHEEMIQNFDRVDRLTLSMLQNALSLAMSAVEQYTKSQEANKTGRYPPNVHCYLEEIKICFKLLFMIRRVDPFKGRDGQANLRRYLTEPKFVPDEVQNVWNEYHGWIKSIKDKIDASIDRLDKDLRYNKPKSRDKEHERLKKKFYELVRNYHQFFGMLENAVIGSDEERKRLQACTILEGHKVNFSVAFEFVKSKGKNAVPNLERAMDQLMTIPEREAFDLEGLISVSLALSTVDPHSKKIPQFKQVYEWCVELSTLAPSTLEPHFFLTMFLWPREDMDIDFDAGLFKLSKERLSNLHKEQCPSHVLRHFQAHKRMTITGYSRAMPATNFFLSTGKGLQSFVHISSLNIESQKNFDRDQFWERPEVQEKLRRLEGICLDQHKISYKVKDGPSIEIHSSRPIAIKGASQEVVSFFLGFSWEDPIAYNVKVQEDW